MKRAFDIQWDSAAGAAQNARLRLPGLLSAFFAEGRGVVEGGPKAANLHAFRLTTKRLRYTLELFRFCYGPGLRIRIASLRRLQQLLGEAQDCAAAGQVLAKRLRGKSLQRTRVEHFFKERAAARNQEFVREWREHFDAPGQEAWWVGYLARHARPPGRKR